MKRSTTGKAFGFCAMLVVSWLVAPMAAERVTIGQLQRYHSSYHLHSVTLVGTVRGMQVFPPRHTFESDRCSPRYGIAQFELVDDTGSLPVITLGSCHPAAIVLPEDGAIVELAAQLQVLVLAEGTRHSLKAIAQTITVLKAEP